MIKYICSILFIFGVVGQLPAYAQIEGSDDAATKFAKKLVKTLRKESVDKVFDYYLSYKDLRRVMRLSGQGIDFSQAQQDDVFAVFEKNKKKHIAQTFQNGRSLGIDWRKVKYVEIGFLSTQTVEGVEQAKMTIYFEIKGKVYSLEMDSCYYLNAEWNVADFMFVEAVSK